MSNQMFFNNKGLGNNRFIIVHYVGRYYECLIIYIIYYY